MNIYTCDYIGAIGDYPIQEELLKSFSIIDKKINLTSNALNSNIYNTSNNLQSNITILKNELWDVNSNNSNGIIKYTYENYQQYNAINTTIYINENPNSKIIFRSRFNNSQLQHNTEIRSDGKLYIYIDGNILPPILPAWYNVGDTFEGIFIKDTEQDVAILGFGGALTEQQSIIQRLLLQVNAMDHMFLATSVLASSPNLVSIGSELTNFALWQYVTGTFIAGLGAVAIGSAVIATRAEGLANMINASYISSNALNAINFNSNISSNDKLIFTSNLENTKFINNQLIASNLYDFNILTGNINTNITTQQYIPSLNTSNLSINNVNIGNVSNLATIKQLDLKQDIFDIIERQYPSRLYDSASSYTTTTFLNQTVFTKTMTLNNNGTTYDYGIYTLWWSTNQSGAIVNRLFDFNINNGFGWLNVPELYKYGIYTGNNYIINDYLGDWIIIKLVKEIKLTKFSFFNTDNYRRGAPAKWKIYGSLDGINWDYIEDASNTQEKILYIDDVGRSYTKSNIYSTKSYLYFGLVVNEIAGSTGYNLSFTEWKIYGVEKKSYQADWNTTIINKPTIINSQWSSNGTSIYYNTGNVGIGTITPTQKLDVIGTIKTDGLIINNVNFNDIIYNTSNGIITNFNNNLDAVIISQSNLNNNFILYNQIYENTYCKKSTFLIETNNLINYDSVNYYTYTIDLTKYLKYLQISDITKLLRFRINATLASSVAVFPYLTECEYKIMMSQSSSIGQTGGFHCRCFGIPEDLNLTKFAPYKFIKTNNIYQLTYISPVAGAKFLITIIDEL